MLLNPYRFGGASGGGGGFAPDDISSLRAWYDPSDSASVTLDGSSRVTAIAEQTGSGVNLENLNTGPTITDVGGIDWMDWDTSANGILRHTEAGEPLLRFGSGEMTIVIVSSWTATGELRLINKGSNNFGRYAIDVNRSGGVGNIRPFLHDGSSGREVLVDNDYNDGEPHIVALVRDNTAGELQLWVDGVDVGSVALTTLGDTDETSTGNLFSDFLIGAGPTGVNSYGSVFRGYMGDILLFNEALSSSDMSDLQDYLATKWGVS